MLLAVKELAYFALAMLEVEFTLLSILAAAKLSVYIIDQWLD